MKHCIVCKTRIPSIPKKRKFCKLHARERKLKQMKVYNNWRGEMRVKSLVEQAAGHSDAFFGDYADEVV